MGVLNFRTIDNFPRILVKDAMQHLNDTERGPQERIKPIAWPSECSASLGPINVGECQRKLFYKIIGAKETEPIDIKGRGICDAGNMYEEHHINKFKQAGLYEDEQLKISFEIPNSKHKIFVSGRMDLVIKSDDTKQGIEIKSVGGYQATKTMGDSKTMPYPSSSNLMQALLYKYYLTYTEEGKALGIEEVYLMYIDRAYNTTFYYKIDLDRDGWSIITAIDQYGKEVYSINTKDIPSFEERLNMPGKTYKSEDARQSEIRINIYDVFQKFDKIYDYVDQKMLPPCDYSHVYTKDELNKELKVGKISKQKYNAAMKGQPLGDSKCNYCSYRTKCLSDSGIKMKS